jgi:8-oxo-dGTP diphosphatase
MVEVTAALLFKDKKLLIAKRKSTDKLPNKWEFPGGKIEDGETPEYCLKREMEEEFEIDVSVGKFLGESIYHYDHGTIKLLAYRTYWKGGSISLKAHDDYQWVSLDQLQDYDFAPADIPFVEKLRRGKIEF